MIKKVLLPLLLCVLLLTMIPSAFAAEQYVSGDYTYEVNSNGEAIITKYTGSATQLTIPDTLNGYPVVEIEPYVFANCNFTSVVLPNSLRSLGFGAFKNCKKLASVYIPKSLESGSDFSDGAFFGCDALNTVTFESGITRIPNGLFKDCTGLKTIVIPQTVTTIDDYAFENCTNLQTVVFSDNLTEIGLGAFTNCGFTSVDLPKTLKTLGLHAFSNNKNLTSVFIPKKLEDGGSAFRGCDKLNSVTFESGITSIARSLFEGCTGLKEIVIPQTVTTIEHSAFSDCTNLQSIVFSEHLTEIGFSAFENCNFTSLTFPKSLKVLDYYAFKNNKNLTSVFIPKNLEDAAYSNGPFWGCERLNNITFESGITRIPHGLFAGCNGLKQIEIPQTVTVIEQSAFENCTGLKEIVIPQSVTTIEIYAFRNCTNLQAITFSDNLTEIEYRAFEGCTALESVTLPNKLTKLPLSLFAGCTNLKQVEIPQSVTSIGQDCFRNCSSLVSIEIPGSVTDLGSNIFRGCEKLQNVTLGVNVTKIPDNAFYDCSSLEKIILPFSVKTVGANVFVNCVSLTEITIPRYTTSINKNAFSYPGQLTVYGVTGTTAESYASEIGAKFVAINKPAQSVRLNVNTLSLEKNKKYRLIPAITPVDFTDEVKWQSSDTTVATVDAAGMVTAKKNGTTTITFTAGTKSASCVVTVGTHSHSYTEVSVTAPTCTTAGQRTLACTCGDIKTETIPATGHNYVSGTCTHCGATEVTPPANNPYTDVAENAWYYPGVMFSYDTGLMNGMGNNLFRPDTEMNRAMLVTVMWRYAGSPVVGTNTFSDVPDGTWYTQAVAWASHTGIVNGVGNGRFNPEGIITREQLVTLVYRYCTYAGFDTSARADLRAFPDHSKTDSWAKEACSWAVAVELLKGNVKSGVTYLDPLANATRGQVATFFMRMDAYLKK